MKIDWMKVSDHLLELAKEQEDRWDVETQNINFEEYDVPGERHPTTEDQIVLKSIDIKIDMFFGLANSIKKGCGK